MQAEHTETVPMGIMLSCVHGQVRWSWIIPNFVDGGKGGEDWGVSSFLPGEFWLSLHIRRSLLTPEPEGEAAL